MLVKLHDKEYEVEDADFPVISDDKEWTPLKVRDNVAALDREIGLLKDLAEIFEQKSIVIIGDANRGYVPINLLESYDRIYFQATDPLTQKNIQRHDATSKINPELTMENISVVYVPPGKLTIPMSTIPVVISDISNQCPGTRRFKFNGRYIFVHPSVWSEFYSNFRYYIVGDELKYDNLINLLIMVKDGGDSLRNILEQNMPYVDRWTILDTGSTDDTVNVVKDVL